MNQLEKATHMDLNGDGRVGGGYGHGPPQQQYAPQGYPPQYNQYGGGAPCPPNYGGGGAYGGPGGYPQQYNQYGPPPPQQQYNQYGPQGGYGGAPHHGGGGGGGLMSQLEKVTNMDLNGDGRIGGGAGRPQGYNQYGHHY